MGALRGEHSLKVARSARAMRAHCKDSPTVPGKLLEFVVMALWRKLPVAQRLAQFKVTEGQGCPSCGVAEDHDHVFKKCFFL